MREIGPTPFIRNLRPAPRNIVDFAGDGGGFLNAIEQIAAVSPDTPLSLVVMVAFEDDDRPDAGREWFIAEVLEENVRAGNHDGSRRAIREPTPKLLQDIQLRHGATRVKWDLIIKPNIGII